MGLFDDTFKSTVVTYSPRNEQEAWIAVMHACIAVDEKVADEELEELSQTLAKKALFEDHPVRDYYRSVLLAHADIGSKHLIDNSVEFISPEQRPALFAAAIDLILADGILAEKEEELVTYLKSALELEDKVTSKIIHNKLNNSPLANE